MSLETKTEIEKIKCVQNLLEIFLARRTTRTTVTRVIAATMIEQRDGEVDAPARRKNLGIRLSQICCIVASS